MESTFLSRFRKNSLGTISLFYIVFISLIALFAYQIIPNDSSNENTMHLSIHSKPVLYSTDMLYMPFIGQNSQNGVIPIEQLKLENGNILYQTKGDSYFKKLNLKRYKKGISIEELKRSYVKKKTFILGTDKFGRDVLSRLLIGARVSISIGWIAVFISLLIGVVLGAIAGYYGGWFDKIIVFFINVVWSIPTLLVIIAITLALGKGFWQVYIAVGLTMWVEIARVTRGEIKNIKERDYISASKVLGYSNFKILFSQIIPLIYPTLIVLSALNFASAILIESGLNFLGVGAQPPTPSWGNMVKENFRYIILGKPFLAIIPGVAIMSLVLSFMLLGNSLRDAFDLRN